MFGGKNEASINEIYCLGRFKKKKKTLKNSFGPFDRIHSLNWIYIKEKVNFYNKHKKLFCIF